MRILITVQPQMYREALALALHQNRPDAEVLLGSVESMDGEVERFGPHMLVRNDTDGSDPELLTGVLCRIDVLYSDGMNAKIYLDGRTWEIENISIDDLISLVDETERLISERGSR